MKEKRKENEGRHEEGDYAFWWGSRATNLIVLPFSEQPRIALRRFTDVSRTMAQERQTLHCFLASVVLRGLALSPRPDNNYVAEHYYEVCNMAVLLVTFCTSKFESVPSPCFLKPCNVPNSSLQVSVCIYSTQWWNKIKTRGAKVIC
jgi:hypothetical protein